MNTFKLIIGIILLSIAIALICVIDSFSIGGMFIAFAVIYFCGRDGFRMINKYSKEKLLD